MPNKGKYGHDSTPTSHRAAEDPRFKAVMEIAERARKQTERRRAQKPKGLRKALNFAGDVVGSASAVGNNVDSLLKIVSGKRLSLPKKAKRVLNDPVTFVSDSAGGVERLARRRLGKAEKAL